MDGYRLIHWSHDSDAQLYNSWAPWSYDIVASVCESQPVLIRCEILFSYLLTLN